MAMAHGPTTPKASIRRNAPTGTDQLRGRGPEHSAGVEYRPELLSPEEERGLVSRFRTLAFKAFEFHGHLGNRRTISFGFHYDFAKQDLLSAADMPEFLLPIRERAARFAEIPASDMRHALITEYRPGAGIGWHKDKSAFQDVVGISLVSPCVIRLRRRNGSSWERMSFSAEPRSAYLLRGPVRTEWEHSIRPLSSLRYSITFRSLRSS
jgi:alkylated DNA repair dioxygenase AlkB